MCRFLQLGLRSAIVAAVMVAALLRWGGYLLVHSTSLPARVDGAVVLQGSVVGEKARVAGAVQLLQRATTDKILISVPKESYWGVPVAPIAYAYNEKVYGQEMASRFIFCESDEGVDSTEEEARVLLKCVQAQGWQSVAVVTSDYHTRRAGMIWNRTVREQGSQVRLWIYGVKDPDFQVSAWWRERHSAKTWLLEFTKLLWTLVAR